MAFLGGWAGGAFDRFASLAGGLYDAPLSSFKGLLTMAQRILVADKLADEGLEELKASGMEYDVKVGLKEEELAAETPKYDAMVVRSGAKVKATVLANPGKMRVIARA